MSETRATIRHMPVYLAASLLNRGTAFLQLLILTNYVPAEEYGVLGVIIVASEIIGEAIALQLPTAVARFYFDSHEDSDRNGVVATAVLGMLGLMAIAAPILLLFNGPLSALLLRGEDVPQRGLLLTLGVGCMLCNGLFEIALNFLRAQKRSTAVLVASTTRSLGFLSLTGVFVMWLHKGALGALTAQFITFSIAAAVMLVPVFLRTGAAFSGDRLAAMLRFGAPLFPALLAENGRRLVERDRVAVDCSLADAGRYYLGSRFADLMATLLITSFAHVYAVHRFEAYRAGRPDPDGPRLFTYFFLIMTSSCLALSLMAPEVVRLVAPKKFFDAAVVMPLMMLAITIFSISLIVELGIYYTKSAYRITIAAFITLAIHVPLTYFLVKRFGALGAASAACAAVAIRIALTAWMARGLGGPKPEWFRLAGILLPAVAAYALGLALDMNHDWTGSVSRAIVAGLFPMAVLLSPLFREEERDRLLQALSGALRRIGLRVAVSGAAKP
ncbi:MAG: oligosaccharide flippase family protein [Planctomycetota bacterium]|nr:oligosaccharide flippase family protein [Planctomycetota bacterium]